MGPGNPFQTAFLRRGDALSGSKNDLIRKPCSQKARDFSEFLLKSGFLVIFDWISAAQGYGSLLVKKKKNLWISYLEAMLAQLGNMKHLKFPESKSTWASASHLMCEKCRSSGFGSWVRIFLPFQWWVEAALHRVYQDRCWIKSLQGASFI